MKITFKDLEDLGCESVTDYCRLLVKDTEIDYSDVKILVYRGNMLCLTVNDVYEAAKVDVLENKYTGPKFVKYVDKSMSEEAKATLALKGRLKGSTVDRTCV